MANAVDSALAAGYRLIGVLAFAFVLGLFQICQSVTTEHLLLISCELVMHW